MHTPSCQLAFVGPVRPRLGFSGVAVAMLDAERGTRSGSRKEMVSGRACVNERRC